MGGSGAGGGRSGAPTSQFADTSGEEMASGQGVVVEAGGGCKYQPKLNQNRGGRHRIRASVRRTAGSRLGLPTAGHHAFGNLAACLACLAALPDATSHTQTTPSTPPPPPSLLPSSRPAQPPLGHSGERHLRAPGGVQLAAGRGQGAQGQIRRHIRSHQIHQGAWEAGGGPGPGGDCKHQPKLNQTELKRAKHRQRRSLQAIIAVVSHVDYWLEGTRQRRSRLPRNHLSCGHIPMGPVPPSPAPHTHLRRWRPSASCARRRASRSRSSGWSWRH